MPCAYLIIRIIRRHFKQDSSGNFFRTIIEFADQDTIFNPCIRICHVVINAAFCPSILILCQVQSRIQTRTNNRRIESYPSNSPYAAMRSITDAAITRCTRCCALRPFYNRNASCMSRIVCQPPCIIRNNSYCPPGLHPMPASESVPKVWNRNNAVIRILIGTE